MHNKQKDQPVYSMPDKEIDSLANIVKTCKDIASDISAYGPHIHGEVFRDSLGSVSEIISDTERNLERLSSVLSQKKTSYVRAQLDSLGVDDNSVGLRLNIGSSVNSIEDWINIDFFHSGLSMNINWPLPFGDNSVECVYFCLTLEHLHYKKQAHSVLVEICRVLSVGGVMRVVVPDIEKYIMAYANNDQAFFDHHKLFWDWTNYINTPLEYILAWSGLHQEKADFFGHKMGYDFTTLSKLLDDAGFSEIVRHDYMKGDTPELLLDIHSRDAVRGCGDKNYNLFVEAKKSSAPLNINYPSF